jgi:hypothetical protein
MLSAMGIICLHGTESDFHWPHGPRSNDATGGQFGLWGLPE